MKFFAYLLTILTLLPFSASAQKSSYFKRVFVDAEYFLLYEEYKDALPLYLEIHKSYPNNANISYRIGQCYLNIPNEKHKAIPFFELAIKDITPLYREGYFTEQQAPREAYLNYGRSLRIIGEFQKAIDAFSMYISLLSDTDLKEKNMVVLEIQSVEYAMQMKDNPINVKFTSVGRNVNTRFPETNPLVSANNKVLVYTSVQQFYNAIMVSYYDTDGWSHPLNINSQLFADGPIHTVGLSANGKTMLLSRNDNDIYNLYISSFDSVKSTWSVISKLPKEINTRSWENYGSFSPTGDTIYFSSNRLGGTGGFDIYMSSKTSTGWTEAKNIGSTINTTLDEIAPFVSHDGKKLFFASKGHPNMGGYDIFVSYRLDGKWTKPINLGYPLNTPDDDIFFFPLGDGSSGYVSRMLPQSFGENDIYFIEFESKKNGVLNKDGDGDTSVSQGSLNSQVSNKNGNPASFTNQ